MVSPNHDVEKEAKLLWQDHHLIWYVVEIVDSGLRISLPLVDLPISWRSTNYFITFLQPESQMH